MACKCTNLDGTLSDRCLGTCIKASIIKQQEDANRDPMNGFAELILSQVDKRIQFEISCLKLNFQKDSMALYKEAFLEGLKEGISIGDRLYRD